MQRRLPLAPLNSNVNRRKELPSAQRAKIVAEAQSGHKPAETAELLNIPISTVKTTLQRDPERNNHLSNPQTGRPRCYTDRDERTLLRVCRANPNYTHEQLLQRSGVICSKKTMQRILKNHGITTRIAKKRPKLSSNTNHLTHAKVETSPESFSSAQSTETQQVRSS